MMRYRNSATGVVVSCDTATIAAMGPGWVPADGQTGSSGLHLHFDTDGSVVPGPSGQTAGTDGKGNPASESDQGGEDHEDSEPEGAEAPSSGVPDAPAGDQPDEGDDTESGAEQEPAPRQRRTRSSK